jgi:hypothetical protein
LRVEICASGSLPLRSSVGSDELVVGGKRHADRAFDIGGLGSSPLSSRS